MLGMSASKGPSIYLTDLAAQMCNPAANGPRSPQITSSPAEHSSHLGEAGAMSIGHDPALLVQRDYPWGPSGQNGGVRLTCRTLQGQDLNGPMMLPCPSCWLDWQIQHGLRHALDPRDRFGPI